MNAHTFLKVDKATFYGFVQAQAEGRYEYVRGRIMQQMTGGTFKHAQIAKRFISALDKMIDASRSAINGSDRGVETSETVRYPDVSVEPIGADPDSLATLEPTLIVEVMSPSSEDRDMYVKPGEYLGIPTLQAYIIASQDEAACFVYLRQNDGRFPQEPSTIQGLDESIDIPSLFLSIPLAEIYRGLALPNESAPTGTAPADATQKD